VLPPGFRLHPIREPVRPVLEGNSAHETAETVRPAGIGQKRPQHRAAEKLPACPDLRRDGKFAEPAVNIGRTVLRYDVPCRVVEACFEGERNILREKDLRSCAERRPLVPVMLRISVFASLVEKDRHDRESVVWLKKQLLYDEQLFSLVDELCRVRNSRSVARIAKIARRPGSVLNGD